MATIDELKSRFDSLVKQREDLTAKKVGAESRYQMATENFEQALKEIQERYGVATLEEAKALYEKKKAELETTLNKCELELGEG